MCLPEYLPWSSCRISIVSLDQVVSRLFKHPRVPCLSIYIVSLPIKPARRQTLNYWTLFYALSPASKSSTTRIDISRCGPQNFRCLLPSPSAFRPTSNDGRTAHHWDLSVFRMTFSSNGRRNLAVSPLLVKFECSLTGSS
jgi:hypothetical protein